MSVKGSFENHAEQQTVTDLWQIVRIVSEARALETNGRNILFVGHHNASSQTSVAQTLNTAKHVVTSCVGLTQCP